MTVRRLGAWLAVAATALTLPASAPAQEDPDPSEFTPRGYRFCGWLDFESREWRMTWDESLAGASVVLFARRMSCGGARLNYSRVRYGRRPPYRPYRTGYRCIELEQRHEYSDVRCTRRGTSLVSFRWQSGA